MQTEMLGTINETICSILEQYAFMFADPVAAENAGSAAPEYLMAHMNYTGEQQGYVALSAPRSLAALITENILGIAPDPENALEVECDAVKELLNVFCGQILTALFDDHAIFHLGIPDVKVMDPSGWETLLHESSICCFEVEGHPLAVQILILGE